MGQPGIHDKTQTIDRWIAWIFASLSESMSKRVFLLVVMGVLAGSAVVAQNDTLRGESSEEVIVTATRTERKLSNVAVPAFVISKQQIEAVQLRRLNELLQEQTGVFITNGSGSGGFGGGIFGNGAQLQGMSAEYTMILINGEPIVGRQGGTINLSRLTLSNIKKIEVIKGPASSLYGSEAMGGVINIITELPVQNTLEGQVKAGGYGLFDATANAAMASRKTKAQFSYNHFKMGGIDHDRQVYGFQQDPFATHTLQSQVSHQFSNKTRLLVYGRYYAERARNAYEVADENLKMVRVSGDTRITDANINTSLIHNFSNKVSSFLRVYGTAYHSSQQLNLDATGASYYTDNFNQQFLRLENQTDIKTSTTNTLTAGGGYVWERLNTTRYAGIRTNGIGYAFVQNEWKPRSNLNIIGGLRYDANQQYASRLSPKLAVRYSPNHKLKLTASYGAGFKAPDFRQLYLSFINNASAGYTLFGANEISMARLQQLQQQGFVGEILERANDLAELKPETSHGFNAGAHYRFSQKWHAEVNAFYNKVSNQILFDVIALRSNGAQVFSYFNVARSFTTGAEFNAGWQATPEWQITGGYQLLFTGDRDVLDKIDAGQMFGRRQGTNEVFKMTRADYLGLPGRSRHMTNLKVMYRHATNGWNAALRAVHRSRWGTFDQDGNGIINRNDETAEGFVMLNATVGKQINRQWQVAVGVENILNYRDASNLPNIPGINGWVSVAFNIVNKKQP
jgi:outer membrane receptor for ferrienterochelin and colicins